MTEEFYRLIKEAFEGSDVAQTFLGAHYYNGWKVEKDYKKAFRLFSLGAEKKFAQALFNTGVCYLRGEGVEKDPERAYRLFDEAAAQGCTKGLNYRYTRTSRREISSVDEEKHSESAHKKKYMPQAAKDKLAEKIDESSPRAKSKQIKRNEAIENFPWMEMGKKSFEVNLMHVKQLMDKELYGLDVAKRQVQRFLAVCKRKPCASLRPLLLIGPPGTGKSSFGKAIADALNKPLKRISMPSIIAGWEFTGSCKYWETAGCGIIVQSIIDAGKCPVFLIDEVDKGSSISGRYASAQHGLLALLDDCRESFMDEFFEVPIDLQNTLFILTANDMENVDRFVLDRCKVINIEGYRDIEDRRIILENYIFPKLYKEYNLASGDYEIPAAAIDLILSEGMDSEGGLRTLQTQAETVLQEAILCMEINQNKGSYDEVLTQEDIGGVLSEMASTSNRVIGFCAECD